MPNNYDTIARKLQRLNNRLPVLVGNEVINFALDNFDKQGFDTGHGVRKWDERGGKHGQDPRPGGKLLIGKQGGRLRRSIRRTRTTPSVVHVGSDEVYAGIHNEGGEIKVSVTAKSRRFFWAMYYQTKQIRWKRLALTKKRVLTINMPERRFLGPSEALNRRIIKLLERELEKCYR